MLEPKLDLRLLCIRCHWRLRGLRRRICSHISDAGLVLEDRQDVCVVAGAQIALNEPDNIGGSVPDRLVSLVRADILSHLVPFLAIQTDGFNVAAVLFRGPSASLISAFGVLARRLHKRIDFFFGLRFQFPLFLRLSVRFFLPHPSLFLFTFTILIILGRLGFFLGFFLFGAGINGLLHFVFGFELLLVRNRLSDRRERYILVGALSLERLLAVLVVLTLFEWELNR